MSTEQEALRLAALLGKEIERTVKFDCLMQDTINEIRKLVAEREADRAAMREALEALIEIRRLESLGLDWASVSADAITHLRQRLEGTT